MQNITPISIDQQIEETLWAIVAASFSSDFKVFHRPTGEEIVFAQYMERTSCFVCTLATGENLAFPTAGVLALLRKTFDIRELAEIKPFEVLECLKNDKDFNTLRDNMEKAKYIEKSFNTLQQ